MKRKLTNVLVTAGMDGIREVTLLLDGNPRELTLSYDDAKKLLAVIDRPQTFFDWKNREPAEVPNELPADV